MTDQGFKQRFANITRA